LFVSVYQNRRFDRDYLQVQKILNEGKLGNIKEAEIRFDRFRTEPSGKQHKENPDQVGSGSLHDLEHILWIRQYSISGILKTFADVFSMKGKEFANDYFEILLFYPNDLRVRLKSSVFTKEDHYAYKIHGEKGSFLQERTDNQENELVAGAIPEYGKEWTQPLKETDGILNYLNENSETERILLQAKPEIIWIIISRSMNILFSDMHCLHREKKSSEYENHRCFTGKCKRRKMIVL
jgi:predicted dehydrogenase